MNLGSDRDVASSPAGEAHTVTGWRAPQGVPTITLLLRHGQTGMSAQGRFAGRGDIQLTPAGRQQAAAVAARLAESGGIDLVVTSPLSRALDTARAVADATGVPLALDDDLVETDFGAWEGLTFGEVLSRWPAELARWQADVGTAPPAGESFADVAKRVNGALDRLLAEHPGQTAVVVSHVTPIKTIICRALQADSATMFRMHLDVAALCEVDWFADGPALLRSLNDTAHLQGR
ncbi:MAG: histidine phosphatase family protein [Actinobacteria bacterium]|nr:histidine phosphatase family protein [Actinomycetota bacterium]MBO0836379.1 histidine phosphatase family protein [Actinomycetota bacterium]